MLVRTIGDLVALGETVHVLGRRPERLTAMREALERMHQQVRARRPVDVRYAPTQLKSRCGGISRSVTASASARRVRAIDVTSRGECVRREPKRVALGPGVAALPRDGEGGAGATLTIL